MKIKMYAVSMHTDTQLHELNHTKPIALERTAEEDLGARVMSRHSH